VLACKEKALYLLKFPGVSRNPLKVDGEGKWKQSWVAKNKNWSKLSMAVSTVGKLKHVREHVRGQAWVWSWGVGGSCMGI